MSCTRLCVIVAAAALHVAAAVFAQNPPASPPSASTPTTAAEKDAPSETPTARRAPPTDAMPFEPNLPIDPSRRRGDAPTLRVDAENGVAFPTDI